jgi:hypothetical protein
MAESTNDLNAVVGSCDDHVNHDEEQTEDEGAERSTVCAIIIFMGDAMISKGRTAEKQGAVDR